MKKSSNSIIQGEPQYIGRSVTHWLFGRGVITKIESRTAKAGDYQVVKVRFDGLPEEKAFLFPSCFQLYLKLEDQTAAAEAAFAAAEEEALRHEKPPVSVKTPYKAPTGKELPVPANIQWGVSHPSQGGDCSGK